MVSGTSSYRDGTSGWIEWAHGENFRQYDHAWLLEPTPARIFVLDSDGLEELKLRYRRADLPERWQGLRSISESPDWELLARDYDALWLPQPDRGRLLFDSMLIYTFDCESTIWFRWCFKSNPRRVEIPATQSASESVAGP